MGTFGPVSASVSRRNPCSECCSQPFSDSFSTHTSVNKSGWGSCGTPLGTIAYMRVARERPPVERIVRPFQDFADKQSSGGILLIVATAVALLWANSPWAESYAALWHTRLTVGVGDFSVSKDLTHWINDGLMAVFFFVVGLEIKREVLVGELSSARNAVLPVVAALGGAAVPALIYLTFNAGTKGAAG